MPIFLIIIVLVVAASIIFSVAVRTSVFNALSAAGMFAQGAWRRANQGGRIRNFFATIPGYIGLIFTTAWQVAAVSLVVLVAIWAVWFVMWLTIGYFTNSLLSGLIIGILLPLWSIMFILVKIPVVRTAVRIPYWVATIALLVATVHIGAGIWSPDIKGGWNRWLGDRKLELANSLDKKSKQSESESGIFAIVAEETQLLNEELQPFGKIIGKGTTVMVTNLGKKKVADEDSEGLTRVMVPDRFGNFVKGSVGYVPSRVLDWSWKEYPSPVKEAGYVSPPTTSYSPPPAPQAPTPAVNETPEKDYSGKYKLCWAKKEGMPLDQCIRPLITARDGKLAADYSFGNGNARMKFCGSEKESGEYEGNFLYDGVEGNFTRGFKMNLGDLSGYIINSAGQQSELMIEKLS